MTMTIFEKKALYAFGCPNREATVERLHMIAVLAPDCETKKLFFNLAVKLSATVPGVGIPAFSALPRGNDRLLRSRADHETGRTQHL